MIHDKGSEKSEPKTGTKPRWMERLDAKMSLLRREISQICEEMRRIPKKKNKVLTMKLPKSRKWMMQEMKGNITIASLTVLKEKKINILRATKNEREKKKAASVRFKTNQWFDSDDGSFYKHLKNIVKATHGNIKPKFKSRDSGPGR